MASPVIELKIVSASDLKKPGPFSSALQPDVVASISGTGAASPTLKTPVDSSSGRNPTWNHPLTLPIPSSPNNDALSLFLRFHILSRRSLSADKFLGEVLVPLRDVLHSPSAAAENKLITYQIKKPSGKPKGVLTFSYRISGYFSGVSPVVQPVMAYPASSSYPPPPRMPLVGKYHVYPPHAAPGTSYGYPAQAGYNYGYPSQTGYGYGYGYNGQVVQPNRKKSSGLGLGAGLLGGALAGFLVGDLVSDAAFDFGGGEDSLDRI